MKDSDEAPPAVLLRRLMWLLGCWSQQIPASLRPPLVLAAANVMNVSKMIRWCAASSLSCRIVL